MNEINYTPKLSAIYQPIKAQVGADLALNLYSGCGNGCTVCAIPEQLHISKTRHNKPAPRRGIIVKLLDDCRRMKEAGDKRKVLVSPYCDPYNPLDIEHQLTKQAIEIFNLFDINYVLLSKGMVSARDFSTIQLNPTLCTYGIRLIYYQDVDSLTFEPNAVPTSVRLSYLWAAHKLGLKTCAVLEYQWDYETTIVLLKHVKFAGTVYINNVETS